MERPPQLLYKTSAWLSLQASQSISSSHQPCESEIVSPNLQMGETEAQRGQESQGRAWLLSVWPDATRETTWLNGL